MDRLFKTMYVEDAVNLVNWKNSQYVYAAGWLVFYDDFIEIIETDALQLRFFVVTFTSRS